MNNVVSSFFMCRGTEKCYNCIVSNIIFLKILFIFVFVAAQNAV